MKSIIKQTEFKLDEKKREYYKIYKRKYRAEGKDVYKKSYDPHYHRDYQRRARVMVIKKYGGKCKCCKEKRIEFLAVDHINGGGGKHRKIIGTNVAMWLIKNKFPKGFQILCHNCNMAKGFWGTCPHKLKTLTK